MFSTFEKRHVITLANGTGKGVLAGSERGGIGVRPAPEPRASAVTQQLHHDLELALEEHRSAQLQEANTDLAEVLSHAQARHAESEQGQQRQTEFLAVLAHELRNPLTSIRNAAELLGRIGSDQEVLPRVQAIIERQVVHISRLVDDLLDLARVSTGKLRLECSLIDLRAIVEAAVESCRPEANRRGQRLAVTVPAAPLEIHGDPVRLAQVLGNLLDNACKWARREVTLKVELPPSTSRARNRRLSITVADDGPGLNDEQRARIGKRGLRLDETKPGSGLGLSIVMELVHSYGGTCELASAPQGGLAVHLTLPAG